ncbi:hypothetical protein OC861_001623 [Tilletia horrida]|nr:hypothetical protein OC861_001623 [Tilletia horrida]
MPEELPRIDVDSPEDLEYFVQGIRAHALQILEKQTKEKGIAQEHLPLLFRAIDQASLRADYWLLNGQIQLEPNMLVNGLTFTERANQPREMEEYDQGLFRKIGDLVQQTEELTERAIEHRKTLPSARVAALRRKQALLDEISAEEDALKAKALLRRVAQEKAQDEEALERKDDMINSLQTSLQQFLTLQRSIPAKSEAAAEQVEAASRVRQLFQR